MPSSPETVEAQLAQLERRVTKLEDVLLFPALPPPRPRPAPRERKLPLPPLPNGQRRGRGRPPKHGRKAPEFLDPLFVVDLSELLSFPLADLSALGPPFR